MAAYVLQVTLEPCRNHLSHRSFLQSTVFEHATNLSGLVYVPMTAGSLMVDVVVPGCPLAYDSAGKLVATYWCPLTGACEPTCYSFLGMANDW